MAGLPATTQCATSARNGESMADRAAAILKALGGHGNLVELEPCITRLRVEVKDEALVDVAALKAAGAMEVMKAGTVVQVVVGPHRAANLASEIEDLLDV